MTPTSLKPSGMNASQSIFEDELIMVLSYLINPDYDVVHLLARSNEIKLIGNVNYREGYALGWVHSFAVTEKYIIILEIPLRYSLDSIFRGELFK